MVRYVDGLERLARRGDLLGRSRRRLCRQWDIDKDGGVVAVDEYVARGHGFQFLEAWRLRCASDWLDCYYRP